MNAPKTVTILFSLLLIVTGGCLYDDEEDCWHKLGYCELEEPHFGELILQLSRPIHESAIPVWIYLGPVEDSIVLDRFLASASPCTVRVRNDNLSARAAYETRYRQEHVIVDAKDGGTLEPESKDRCEGICYEEGELKLDLRLMDGLTAIRGAIDSAEWEL